MRDGMSGKASVKASCQVTVAMKIAQWLCHGHTLHAAFAEGDCYQTAVYSMVGLNPIFNFLI